MIVWKPAGEQSHTEHIGLSLEKCRLEDGKHVPSLVPVNVMRGEEAYCLLSVQFSRSVMSDYLRPHES